MFLICSFTALAMSKKQLHKIKFEEVEYEDLKIYGISSSLKAHTIAWHINTLLKVNLKRTPDFSPESIGTAASAFRVAQYALNENASDRLILLENKTEIGTYAAVEHQNFDYFLFFDAEETAVYYSDLLAILKQKKRFPFTLLGPLPLINFKNIYLFNIPNPWKKSTRKEQKL